MVNETILKQPNEVIAAAIREGIKNAKIMEHHYAVALSGQAIQEKVQKGIQVTREAIILLSPTNRDRMFIRPGIPG
jgi:hypothetical protein